MYQYGGGRGGGFGGGGGWYNQQQLGNRKFRNAADRDRMMYSRRGWGNNPGGGGGGRGAGGRGGGNWRWSGGGGGWGGNDRRGQQRTLRDASVQIKPSWELLEEMDFVRLSKLMLPTVKDPEDV